MLLSKERERGKDPSCGGFAVLFVKLILMLAFDDRSAVYVATACGDAGAAKVVLLLSLLLLLLMMMMMKLLLLLLSLLLYCCVYE